MKPASLLTRLKAWFKAATLRSRFEHDMDDEIRHHLDEHTRALMDKGVPEAEARRQARIAFGGAETSRDGVRRALGLRPLDELLADLRYAARVLWKSPGFTLIAAGSLALAIGANTTIFSVAHFMLLERLAVPKASELRTLYQLQDNTSVLNMTWGSNFVDDRKIAHSDSFPYPVYRQMRQDALGFGVELFAFKNVGTTNVSFDGQAQAVQVQLVSGNFYQQMQARPELGRTILPGDDAVPGAGAVAVLSYAFWQSGFGGAANVLGKTVRVDTLPVTIVGVNARNFTGAESVQRSPELFLPMSMIVNLRGTLGKEHVLESYKLSWIQLMLRKPANMPETLLHDRLEQSFHAAVLAGITPGSGETVPGIAVEDGSRGMAQSARFLRKPIYVLLGLVACVLMLACANIANLMLARAHARQREISVRLALGAGRSRVFRQLLVESLLLAAVGGLAGSLLGYMGTTASSSFVQLSWERTSTTVPFQWPVLVFTAGVTVLTGLLFGLAPAWQSTRTDVNTALKQGARSASRKRKAWTGKGLVAFQVALATLLIAGSVLFVRTMTNLSSIQPGFQPHGLLLFYVQPPNRRYAGQKSTELFQRIAERLAAVPGVDGVSAAAVPLISDYAWNSRVRIEGEPPTTATAAKHGTGRYVNMDPVGPDFFTVMQIPILAGRSLSLQDTPSTPDVAVVNHSFAQTYFKSKNPIGRRFTTDGPEDPQPTHWITIVGVCADTQYSDLRTKPGPIMFTASYQSHNQTDGAGSSSFIVRSRVPPRDLIPAIRQAAAQVDRDLPLVDIRTQIQQIRDISRQERLFATLTAGFGILALALACVGIYGIMAYTVSQRTHEIGIRLALGAARGRIHALVLREATWLAVLGVAVGLSAALALAKLVKSLLYGLEPRDPLSLTLAAALLLTVALSAAWLPAARAARLEPTVALRQD